MEEFDLEKENLALSSGIQMVKSAFELIPGLSPFVNLYSNNQQNVQYNNIVMFLKNIQNS